MVTINGKNREMQGKTISEMLAVLEYRVDAVAVERNEVIISKAEFADTVLEDGDVVEVVSFMGGGSR